MEDATNFLYGFQFAPVAIFFLLQFIVFPVLEEKNFLERGVKVKEAGLREILKLREEYETYKKDTHGIQDVLKRREKGFTLFSFLEKAAGEAGVKSSYQVYEALCIQRNRSFQGIDG